MAALNNREKLPNINDELSIESMTRETFPDQSILESTSTEIISSDLEISTLVPEPTQILLTSSNSEVSTPVDNRSLLEKALDELIEAQSRSPFISENVVQDMYPTDNVHHEIINCTTDFMSDPSQLDSEPMPTLDSHQFSSVNPISISSDLPSDFPIQIESEPSLIHLSPIPEHEQDDQVECESIPISNPAIHSIPQVNPVSISSDSIPFDTISSESESISFHLTPIPGSEQGEQVVQELVPFYLPQFELSDERFFDDDDAIIQESSDSSCHASMIDDPSDDAPSEEHTENEVDATLQQSFLLPVEQFCTNDMVQESFDDPSYDDEPMYLDDLFTEDLDISIHSSDPIDHICKNIDIEDEFQIPLDTVEEVVHDLKVPFGRRALDLSIYTFDDPLIEQKLVEDANVTSFDEDESEEDYFDQEFIEAFDYEFSLFDKLNSEVGLNKFSDFFDTEFMEAFDYEWLLFEEIANDMEEGALLKEFFDSDFIEIFEQEGFFDNNHEESFEGELEEFEDEIRRKIGKKKTRRKVRRTLNKLERMRAKLTKRLTSPISPLKRTRWNDGKRARALRPRKC